LNDTALRLRPKILYQRLGSTKFANSFRHFAHSFPNFYRKVKSARLGLDFRLQSTLTRSGFEIKQRVGARKTFVKSADVWSAFSPNLIFCERSLRSSLRTSIKSRIKITQPDVAGFCLNLVSSCTMNRRKLQIG